MNTDLSLVEIQRLAAHGRDPADYLALPVDILVDPGQPVTIARDPKSGERVCVVPLALILPMGLLVEHRIADAQGQKRSPVDGILPVLDGRMVLPRACLSADGLAFIEERPVLRVPPPVDAT